MSTINTVPFPTYTHTTTTTTTHNSIHQNQPPHQSIPLPLNNAFQFDLATLPSTIPNHPLLIIILSTFVTLKDSIPYFHKSHHSQFSIHFAHRFTNLSIAMADLHRKVTSVGFYNPHDQDIIAMVGYCYHLFTQLLTLFPKTKQLPINIVDVFNHYLYEHNRDLLPSLPSLLYTDPSCGRGSIITSTSCVPLTESPPPPIKLAQVSKFDGPKPLDFHSTGISTTPTRPHNLSNASTSSEVSYIKAYLQRHQHRREAAQLETDSESGDDCDEEGDYDYETAGCYEGDDERADYYDYEREDYDEGEDDVGDEDEGEGEDEGDDDDGLEDYTSEDCEDVGDGYDL